MTLTEYNAFCSSLPQAHHVVQWGGADVWKVDVKVFSIAREQDGVLTVTFKASDMGYEIMRDMPGLRPAPYLASRGMKWIQHYAAPGLDDGALKEHLIAAHKMASQSLTKKRQKELGLNQEI